MKYLIILVAVLLAGCSSFDPEPYNIKYNGVTETLVIDPMLGFAESPADWAAGKGEMGRTVCNPAHTECTITLRVYPICLAHEKRHVLEGAWHRKLQSFWTGKEIGNDDDCFQHGQYSR